MEERKDICEGYERDSVQQLDKLAKDKNERFPIYPLTYIQAVYDARTKERLDSILWKCNNVYLPWMGSAGDTRIQLPFWMRRKGIIITYKNLDDETITEKLTYDLCIADDFFRLDSSWTRITDALPVGGNITIGSNGNWFQDGVDTGFKAQGPKGDNGLTPMLRTVNNKLRYSYDGEVWNEISEYIAAWFRYQDNKIQISRDQKTWSDLSKPFTQDLYIKGYVATSSALPSTGVKQGDIYMVGPTYAAEDTEHKNPIYRMYVYNDSGWVDNGVFQSIAAGVVQTIGNSETEVMSQKAVSSIVGLDTYPVFSDTKPYVKGEIVNYGGLLYEFTADHEAGVWIGTDARDTSLRGELDRSISTTTISTRNPMNVLLKKYNKMALYADGNFSFNETFKCYFYNVSNVSGTINIYARGLGGPISMYAHGACIKNDGSIEPSFFTPIGNDRFLYELPEGANLLIVSNNKGASNIIIQDDSRNEIIPIVNDADFIEYIDSIFLYNIKRIQGALHKNGYIDNNKEYSVFYFDASEAKGEKVKIYANNVAASNVYGYVSVINNDGDIVNIASSDKSLIDGDEYNVPSDASELLICCMNKSVSSINIMLGNKSLPFVVNDNNEIIRSILNKDNNKISRASLLYQSYAIKGAIRVDGSIVENEGYCIYRYNISSLSDFVYISMSYPAGSSDMYAQGILEKSNGERRTWFIKDINGKLKIEDDDVLLYVSNGKDLLVGITVKDKYLNELSPVLNDGMSSLKYIDYQNAAIAKIEEGIYDFNNKYTSSYGGRTFYFDVSKFNGGDKIDIIGAKRFPNQPDWPVVIIDKKDGTFLALNWDDSGNGSFYLPDNSSVIKLCLYLERDSINNLQVIRNNFQYASPVFSEVDSKIKLNPYVLPEAIYVTFNDILNDISLPLNYGVKMNIDHIFMDLDKNLKDISVDNCTNFIPFYAPGNIHYGKINSFEKNKTNDILKKDIKHTINGFNIEPFDVSIPMISIRNKATENKKIRLLCIGDSVTAGTLAHYNKPYPESPSTYWEWTKCLFEMDKMQNGDSGFFFESLGNQIQSNFSGTKFDIDFNGLKKKDVRAFANAVGGTSSDLYLTPNLYGGMINPFYSPDKNTFSLKYWVDNYRTLIVKDDGTTERCTLLNKGTLAPDDTTQYNVCEPTHVLISLVFNDLYDEKSNHREIYKQNFDTILNSIKEEYPNVKVLLGFPDVPSSYFMRYYPEYFQNSEYDTQHPMNMFYGRARNMHNSCALMTKDVMEICKDHDNAYFVPIYFVTPGPIGMPTRNISELGSLALNDQRLKLFDSTDNEPICHPNCIAHANFAYQIYSMIKYLEFNQ